MATIPAISLEPVNSSRVAAIGFDPDTFTLAVRFPPTKKAPAGKIYLYSNVSEELFDDMKSAPSIGVFFGNNIVNQPERYPFVCVDEGLGEPAPATAPAEEAPASPASPAEILSPDMPDDEEGLKTRALSIREEATALSITTADECEAASIEVLRIRADRKLAIEKVNRIKIPATQAWQAACALFNEVDSRYAEAEKYLDGGILAYRKQERQRAEAAAAEIRKQEDARRAEAVRVQQEEFRKEQEAAAEEARVKAAELAEQDAKAAEAQGLPEDIVESIRENPLPVVARHVMPPPLVYAGAPTPIVEQNIPKVAGLSFTMEYFYEIQDESLIPMTHEFYSLDPKKINAKVQSLKKHANIPGIFVDSREVPIKRTGRR